MPRFAKNKQRKISQNSSYVRLKTERNNELKCWPLKDDLLEFKEGFLEERGNRNRVRTSLIMYYISVFICLSLHLKSTNNKQ